MKLSVVLDFLKRHRLQIAVWNLVAGVVLTGTPIPIPTEIMGIQVGDFLPATLAAPIYFPALVGLGKLLLLSGLVGGGFAILTKWLGLGKDDSQKLAKALADATKTGCSQVVETRADRPNVQIIPLVNDRLE